jgi:hypothetical protein
MSALLSAALCQWKKRDFASLIAEECTAPIVVIGQTPRLRPPRKLAKRVWTSNLTSAAQIARREAIEHAQNAA